MSNTGNNRLVEATEILYKFALKIDPKFNIGEENLDLIKVLNFFKTRRQAGTYLSEKKANPETIKSLTELLKNDIDKNEVEEFCEDEKLVQVLVELINKKINPTNIIKYILEDRSENLTNLTQLIFKPEITEDNTAYETATYNENTVVKNKNYNYKTSLDGIQEDYLKNIKISQNAHSTPYLRTTPTGLSNFRTNMNNTTLGQVRPLSIKDTLELIPKYNGIEPPLHKFIQGCRAACEIITPMYEQELTKLIKLRLSGEALKSANDKSFDSIDEIAKFFDRIFGSTKTYHELQGELARIKQKHDESVIVFSNRIQALGQEIKDAARRENRRGEMSNKSLEADLIKFFIRGLHWVIKARMGEARNLQEATAEAIEIERDFACYAPEEINNTVKYITGSKNVKNIESARVQFVESKEVIKCQYCEKLGHTARTCRKIEGNSRMEQVNFRPKQQWTEPTRNPRPAPWLQNKNHVENKNLHDQYLHRQRVTFPKQNNQTFEKMVCRYCQKEGHTIEYCRKRKYQNASYAEAEKEKGPFQWGARKETAIMKRPSYTEKK